VTAERAHLIQLLEDSQAEFLELIAGLSDAQWSYRAAPDAWSIGEIAEHLVLGERQLFIGMRRALAAGPNPEGESRTAGKTELLERVMPKVKGKAQAPESIRPQAAWNREQAMAHFRETRANTRRFVEQTDADLALHTFDHPFPFFGTLTAYQWLLYIPLHNQRHNGQIAGVKASAGFPARALEGVIVQINVSWGGLPKRAITAGTITPLGLAGDACAHPDIHGGPNQAVLIIAAEAVEELQQRGYPVFYGAMGENLTTRGLDRRQLRAGQVLRAGGARLEITKVRGPCAQLNVYGRGIQQEIYDAGVKAGDPNSPRWGLSGFYARVLQPGPVRANDVICVETMLA
jgi:MOSC domain-containing protein YiiM